MTYLIEDTKKQKINWLPLYLCKGKIILPRELEEYLNINQSVVVDSSFILSKGLGALALIQETDNKKEINNLYALPNYNSPMIEIGNYCDKENSVEKLLESINSYIYQQPELPWELYEFFKICLEESEK